MDYSIMAKSKLSKTVITYEWDKILRTIKKEIKGRTI